MPLNAVLDSTILISAFLTPGGVADAVLQGAIENRFTCSLSEDIIAETTMTPEVFMAVLRDETGTGRDEEPGVA
jgi:predicted nucleic acid-binding protein